MGKVLIVFCSNPVKFSFMATFCVIHNNLVIGNSQSQIGHFALFLPLYAVPLCALNSDLTGNILLNKKKKNILGSVKASQ